LSLNLRNLPGGELILTPFAHYRVEARMSPKPRTAHLFAAVVAGLILSALPASAQDRPAPALDLGSGWVGFADDGIVSEWPIAVAARWYLTPRISVGPEVTFIAADSHSHQIVTGNLTVDLLAPRNGAPRITPFILVGGGLFRTSEGFANRPPFSATEGAFTIGTGARVPLTDRAAAGVDARIGWEPHLRITGFVSIGLGGRP